MKGHGVLSQDVKEDVLCCYNKIPETSRMLVAHTCNPSYSEGRDQEDHGSKAGSLPDPVSKKKKPITKKSW
jgi:hypothetical protein